MKLLTQPCVRQFCLCLLQTGKGNYCSVMQQISFIIQISAEMLEVVPEHQPPDPGSFKKGLAQREEDALMLLERTTLTTSPLTPQSWSGSLAHTLLWPSCCCPKVSLQDRSQPFALFQLWNGCKRNRIGLFPCETDETIPKSPAEPGLGTIQGKKQRKWGKWKQNKWEKTNRRWEMALWLPGASQHGRHASGLFFPLFSHSKLSKAIIKIPAFPNWEI